MADLERKLDNLLQHDYPAEKLDVIIGSEGSIDGSAELLQQRSGGRITALINSHRQGKSGTLQRVVEAARGEVLVFTDMRQRLERGSVRALCAALASRQLRAVGGALRFESSHNGTPVLPGAYWRYESWLRQAEAASGSVVGVSGALYAVRRSDMPTLPPGLVLDDLWVPMRIAAGGGRIGLDPRAIAWDIEAPTAAIESARKRRTLAGNWQLLSLWPRLLLPGAHPLWWRFVSHKVLRLLMPFVLVLVLLMNVLLLDEGLLYRLTLVGQLLAYAGGVLAMLWPGARKLSPLRLAAAFLELNLYAVLGAFDFLLRRDAHLWRTTQLETKPEGTAT
jgi:cellulose synthase/poly-beta-1,6-N-acetylglucosamine synthase-like glycosyltransferase